MNRNRGITRALLVLAAVSIGTATWLFFRTQLDGARGPSAPGEAAGVVLAAPAGWDVKPLGASDLGAAAAELGRRAGEPAAPDRLGVEWSGRPSTPEAGEKALLLLDRASGTLDLRSAGSGGIRTQLLYKSDWKRRLETAPSTGSLELPGSPPGEKKNLYH